jgi:arsenate reductase
LYDDGREAGALSLRAQLGAEPDGEGLLRDSSRGRFEVHSAGTEATAVRPLAIAAMRELGIDISRQKSKTLDRYVNDRFEYVITVCDEATKSCPIFPNAEHRLQWSMPDPSKATGTEVEQLAVPSSPRSDPQKDRGRASELGCGRAVCVRPLQVPAHLGNVHGHKPRVGSDRCLLPNRPQR